MAQQQGGGYYQQQPPVGGPPPQPYSASGQGQPYWTHGQQQQQPYQPGNQQWNGGIPANGMQAQPYPQPQQQYQQQQPQPGNYAVKPSEHAELFKPPKPKWNDIIFAVLFYAQLAGFIAISVICLREVTNDGGSLGGSASRGITLNLNTAYLLALIAAAGFVVAIIFLLITKTFTKIILEISLLLSVAFSIGYAIYLWIQKFWSGAIIFTIFAILSLIAYPFMRKRIPLSKLILQFVFRIAKRYPSVYVIAIMTTVLQASYTVFWSFTIVGIYQKFNPSASGACNSSGGQCSQATVIGLIVFSFFSFYWTTQVIQNVSLTTIAGIFGTFYFAMPNSEARHVSLGSFRRAMTYSFGSIAEGSLIVAILDLIKAALNIIYNEQASSGDAIGACIACMASCIIGCIRGLVDYFNRYAYIEIAMFGKSYISAAKDAWRLIKDRGIDALINDSLVNTIWTFGSFACGCLCSFFAYIYLRQVQPSYIQNDSNLYAVILLYAFAIGFQICHSLGYVALSSGVSTIFVALGEAPQALAEKDPALFEHIRVAYPKVVQPV